MAADRRRRHCWPSRYVILLCRLSSIRINEICHRSIFSIFPVLCIPHIPPHSHSGKRSIPHHPQVTQTQTIPLLPPLKKFTRLGLQPSGVCIFNVGYIWYLCISQWRPGEIFFFCLLLRRKHALIFVLVLVIEPSAAAWIFFPAERNGICLANRECAYKPHCIRCVVHPGESIVSTA